MMVKKIKRSGWPFSYDTSNYHGLKPSKFDWVKGGFETSDVTVYFDHDHMGGFNYDKDGLRFLLENFSNNKERLKFLLGGFKYNKERLKFLMKGFNNKSNKDGYHSYCIKCHKQWNYNKYKKDKKKVLASNKRWADANPDKVRDIQLRYTYNITLEDYDKMFEEQKGICKICGGEPGNKSFHVDHNHNTGKIRGLLCNSCNTKLGWYEKQKENIVDYLNEYY